MGNHNSGRKKQETCQQGHKLVGENVITVKRANGKTDRACRTCTNRRQREYWRKKYGKR